MPTTTTTTDPISADLSTNDATVLTHLFDPESASAAASAITIDPTLPSDPHITSPTLLESLRATELRAIRLAEANDLPQARKILTDLTLSSPDYASGFNNLAQVLRMLEASPGEVLAALSRAIELAVPASSSRAGVSARQANLLAQAYTQRGALLYMLFKSGGGGDVGVGVDGEQLEMAASKDFFEGGRYGSEVGREMAVRTNPYARMCGAIVREALTRDYEGGS
ncbi:hypothetical protein Q9L58_005206 [Maublancomyces gigas]|uniref:Tetratricopeptide repeat protein 36 n=1 Tax=Discina gigas TaxID=1032678 RepID=A0ABR3GIV2_9PEZI